MTEEALKALQGIEHNLSGIWTAICCIGVGLVLVLLGHGLRISWRIGELTVAIRDIGNVRRDHLYHVGRIADAIEDKRPWPPLNPLNKGVQ